MSAEPLQDLETSSQTNRRPRIALMGEFSAGKSTLANLLLGQSVSPVKVTATQLPPVWYSHGARSVLRIDNTGAEIPMSKDELGSLSHRDTQAVRISLQAEVLDFCDVIDMPGTSDPNMPQSVWERMLERVDGVVWCTPATQAWRQSEAALWEELPARLHARSLLLITRMDKLLTQKDRDRVVARVRREADGLFSKVLPISLTEAIAARDNPDILERCGADSFVEGLVELVESFDSQPAGSSTEEFAAVTSGKSVRALGHTPSSGTNLPASSAVSGASVVPITEGSVVPRRVVPKRVTRAQPRPNSSV